MIVRLFDFSSVYSLSFSSYFLADSLADLVSDLKSVCQIELCLLLNTNRKLQFLTQHLPSDLQFAIWGISCGWPIIIFAVTADTMCQRSYRPWKVLEKGIGPGKFWNSKVVVLEILLSSSSIAR